MASQGPLGPGTAGTDTSIGGSTWTDPSNALAEDGTLTVANVGDGGISHYLTLTNFGFSIPGGSTINGVIVEAMISTNASGAPMRDNSVRLIVGGIIAGSNKADAVDWPKLLTYKTWGASNDIWGAVLTAADVNGSNFGVAISVVNTEGSFFQRASVDYVRITVHYTAGGLGGGPASQVGFWMAMAAGN